MQKRKLKKTVSFLRLLHWQRCLLFPWQQQKILQDRLRVLVYMCLKAQKKRRDCHFYKKVER